MILALAWFNRAATVKTQQCSRQFDLAATQTYKYYMENHEEIRREHVLTKQEPRASTQSQCPLKQTEIQRQPTLHGTAQGMEH